MDLTNQNYFSEENKKKYMSVSLFKDFLKCEVYALAKATGQIEDKKTDALLFGGYVDAYFSGELDEFIKENPEMFSNRGTLLAKYKNIEDVISTIENDEILMKYLDGEKQVVMTGTIEGVPWKIKIDAYHPGKLIVDQKIMKDLEPVWVERNGFNVKTDFVDAYRYDLQGAAYQEIESQNSESHNKLPFVLAVTTKEDAPDKLLMKIDQEYLDSALDEIKAKTNRFWDILQGKVQPTPCGHCPACRAIKKITGVMSYKKLYKEKED